jgi:hypothetical protein
LCKSSHGTGVVEDEDKVRKLEADLSAETTSYSSDRGGRRPRSIRESRDYNTTSETATAQETSFENGENGQTFGIGENLRWDDLIGAEGLLGVDEGSEDTSAFLTFAWEWVLVLVVYLLSNRKAQECNRDVCDRV